MNEGAFATELRRRRLDARQSLRQLAAAAHCSHSYISDMELGRKAAPDEKLARLLDDALDADGTLVRLAGASHGVAPVQTQAMRVAIATVIRDEEVLLVCRRSEESSSWQFPAGVVKPESSPDVTAVRETLAETGVRCSVRRDLGSRVHPATGVLAEYRLCDYLAGEPENLDPVENVDVMWVPVAQLSKFIAPERIFAPVLTALEGISGTAVT